MSEWHEAYLAEGKEAVTVLVGNKSDLHDQRSIPLAYGTRKADDLGCEYFTETSAHNDINSIKTLFNEICKRVV